MKKILFYALVAMSVVGVWSCKSQATEQPKESTESEMNVEAVRASEIKAMASMFAEKLGKDMPENCDCMKEFHSAYSNCMGVDFSVPEEELLRKKFTREKIESFRSCVFEATIVMQQCKKSCRDLNENPANPEEE